MPPPAAATTQVAAAAEPAARVLRAMPLERKVGQLFIVGGPATGVGSATRTAVTRYHVGGVMLSGRSAAGVAATARVSAGVQARAVGGVPLFVATDQEGGAVQVLRGPGFTDITTALDQGRWSAATLQTRAARWAGQLRAAGINLNLAPVADTVPRELGRRNAPIGRFGRQYGFSTGAASRSAIAFSRGMQQAGVVPTVKHFPGLGRVTGNPDVSSGVTDRVTRRGDPYLEPFARSVAAGVPFVMMSTAYYPRIDRSRPAAFSPVVIGTVLRGDLGFKGVVISDDLGWARQVAAVPRGARAVRFVAAGGDVVLTVDPGALPVMYQAVLSRARTDGRFRAQVDAAAARVLQAKQDAGLLR